MRVIIARDAFLDTCRYAAPQTKCGATACTLVARIADSSQSIQNNSGWPQRPADPPV